MSSLVESLQDPLWQIGVSVLVLMTIMAILVVRSPDLRLRAPARQRGTQGILLSGLVLLVIFSSSIWFLHVQSASPHLANQGGAGPQVTALSSPGEHTPIPALIPTSTPTSVPTPIGTTTQMLTLFCQAFNTRDYLTAWEQYSTALQQKHSQQQVYAGWRTFTHCNLTDESADPEVFTVIALTLAPGANSLGSTGDYQGNVLFQFAVGNEKQQWKITSICQIIAEGCFPIDWD